MKTWLSTLALLGLCSSALVVAAEPEKIRDFELTDQHGAARAYRFPKDKVTVMTLADHKGSDQLEPWIQRVFDRYGKRIDIDGVADMSTVPKPLRGMIQNAFRKKLTYSVMLDWTGPVVRQFPARKGVANIYVIDRRGRIVAQLSGAVTDDAARSLFTEIDRAMGD